MKKFNSFTLVRHPVEVIWRTLRDRLPTVASALEDLQAIESIQRTSVDGGVRVLNRWIARQEVPSVLRDYLGKSTIEWTDDAFWKEATKTCAWAIEPSVLTGYIECAGTTRYEVSMGGRGTRVSFEGSFELKRGFGGALPYAIEPVLASFVEGITSAVIPRNLARAIAAAGQLIASEAGKEHTPALDAGSQPDQPIR